MVRTLGFRRPPTRIAALRNRYHALNTRVIPNQTVRGFQSGYQGLVRRRNALRNTASGMISRFLRNPRSSRIGSRYR